MDVRIDDVTDADVRVLDRVLPAGDAHRAHRDRARSGEVDYLAARVDGELVGTGVLRWDGSVLPALRAAHPGVPEVSNLHVAEAARGRGAGTAMLRRAERRARAAGHHQLLLGAGDDADPAARLYARLGYSYTGAVADVAYTWTDADGVAHDERDVVHAMIKDLDD